MLNIDLDRVDADGRALLAADRNLKVVFANARAAERFSAAGRHLDGLPLAALFGPAGTLAGSIGRAVLAAEPAALFVTADDVDDPVRVDAAPLADGVTLIVLDPDGVIGHGEGLLRARVRALTTLAKGFRSVEDRAGAARVAEEVVGKALAARASYFPLVRNGAARLRPAVADRRQPASRHGDLDVPARVRAGDVFAVDDLGSDAPLAADDLARFRERGTAALLWVALVRDGSSVAAMLVEAAEPRRWKGDAVALVASILDRTDLIGARLDAMSASSDAQERFRVLVDVAAAATWEADADGAVTVPSPSWCHLTRQSAPAMLGRGWIDAIHPADRERARAAWVAAVGLGGPFDAEVRLAGAGRPRWMNLKAAPLRRGGPSIAGWVGMAIDISARKVAEEERQAGETRLRSLIEGIPQLLWRAAPGGGRTWSSPQWCRTTGQTSNDSRGAGWLDAIHPDDRSATVERWREATPRAPLQVEHRIRDVATGSHRWFQTRASAVVDTSGAVAEWLGTSTDIDELRRFEEDRRHFIAELQHRTRNLMAVVQSIVRQSLNRAPSPDAFASALEGRLKCLSRVQGVLSRGSRSRIALSELVLMEVDALVKGAARDRISVDGPEVLLRRSSVQLLTLAFHELMENALEHGALSDSEGILSVRWTVTERDGAKAVDIVWEERFGAARETAGHELPPHDGAGHARRSGYGHDLLTSALPYSLGAAVSLTIGSAGVRCTINLPLGDARPAAQS